MVSIIIPVYNAEQYLKGCINSILSQTYCDYEIILVDDGSQDKSGILCDDYVSQYSNITVFHQENKGVTSARQLGVAKANGEWIMFVDSDDTIPQDALENMMASTSPIVDIVLGWIGNCRPMEISLSIEEYRKRNIGRYSVHVGPVAHLYRHNLFDQKIFDIPRDIKMGEDMLMNIRLSFKTNSDVAIVHKVVYNYYIENPNNTTNHFNISMDYEDRFHYYRLKSIPQEFHNIYMNEMIGIRLYDLMSYLNKLPYDSGWRQSNFAKTLMHDMEQHHYHTTKANHLILSVNNLPLQIILLLYKRIRTKFNIRWNSCKKINENVFRNSKRF